MSNKDELLFKSNSEVSAYISHTVEGFGSEKELECSEIGDGNLNYIYRVKNKNSGLSVIVKRAANFARSTQDYRLTIDRNRFEAEVLKYFSTIVPEFVPEVYLYDDEKNCYIMEDLHDYEILRKTLVRHEKNDRLSDQITTFLAKILILTSDIAMDHIEKKAMVKSHINPELCKISEDLVFSDPYRNLDGTNNVFDPNMEFVRHTVYSDERLHLEAAKLKFKFMNEAQALIHGDLHTGSIFINKTGIKVIDPEFAFYGPAGYDIGNVIGNMFFAWANADVTMERDEKREAYMAWVEKTIAEITDMFRDKFTALFSQVVRDEMADTPGFCEWYLDTVLCDSAACAGLEIIRRTIGEAGVEDIRSIVETDKRCRAERLLIRLGKSLIIERACFKRGTDYIEALHEAED